MSERQQELFNLMKQEHQLSLLESEMHNIEHVVLRMSQWQPIEAAPGGTNVLCCHYKNNRSSEILVAERDSVDGIWRAITARGPQWTIEPIYWQPLPEPPKL